MKHETITTP